MSKKKRSSKIAAQFESQHDVLFRRISVYEWAVGMRAYIYAQSTHPIYKHTPSETILTNKASIERQMDMFSGISNLRNTNPG